MQEPIALEGKLEIGQNWVIKQILENKTAPVSPTRSGHTIHAIVLLSVA
jgi:hypothetical protein